MIRGPELLIESTSGARTRSTRRGLVALTASLVLLAAGSTLLAPPASAGVARSVKTKAPLQPTISFPNGDSVVEGGQLAIRFDANGDTSVTSYRYSVGGTSLDSMVPAGPDGAANVTIDVGNVNGERPVYAVAVDRRGRVSPMTQGSFTVSVMWSLRGQALDMNTWLPVAGATIRLEPVGIEVVTGSDGGFQFAVDPGLYTLTGTYAGPPSLSGSSQQLEVDSQGLWFDLYLFPDSGS
ncbi:carboxypeptidase-like regulatory domain-containing protein [Micromonospora halophytica]|uniref:Carboxypeptidase regulatory-like domain-containing protein n=1 Tax=Micromonospora halophytica TaxID=47864 RepID=A0A1C5IYV0_9ACTN|nr:carboxypeptidase-like regulatory domain-containing protein [Micromonospora halophytica]SCG63502.1 hypothetical protein GA0070560_118100 [Micromonospora halophytica]